MNNTASDIVTAALGAYGFIFEGGMFSRYTKTATREVAKTSFIIPSADGSSFYSVTETGDFTLTEAELLRAFPGRA